MGWIQTKKCSLYCRVELIKMEKLQLLELKEKLSKPVSYAVVALLEVIDLSNPQDCPRDGTVGRGG